MDEVIIAIVLVDQGIVSDLIRFILSIMGNCCREVQITVNLSKADATLFPRKF